MPPPVEKTKAGLVKLARGEIAGVRLSGSERSLIQFTQDRFGEYLTRFLLSGLGEEVGMRRRLSIISFTQESGGEVRRRLYAEAEDINPETDSSLPCDRDPLVMLALLRLLMRVQKMPRVSLSYEVEELLSLLGWEDSAETRLAVDGAIDRYSCTSYRWALSRKEMTARRLSFYRSRERFVSSYELLDSEEEGGRMSRVSNRVDFSAAFIDGLESRTLFDVVWDSVRLLKASKP